VSPRRNEASLAAWQYRYLACVVAAYGIVLALAFHRPALAIIAWVRP
jgi:hypothetical protein